MEKQETGQMTANTSEMVDNDIIRKCKENIAHTILIADILLCMLY